MGVAAPGRHRLCLAAQCPAQGAGSACQDQASEGKRRGVTRWDAVRHGPELARRGGGGGGGGGGSGGGLRARAA
jgi:hypothetical protein